MNVFFVEYNLKNVIIIKIRMWSVCLFPVIVDNSIDVDIYPSYLETPKI